MPRKFKFCFHCRRTITEKEVQRGLFAQTPQGMLCATCAQELHEETDAAKKLTAAPSTMLRAALSEVERAAQEPAPADPPAPPVEAPPEPAVEKKPVPVRLPEAPKKEPLPARPPEPPKVERAPEPPGIPQSALRTLSPQDERAIPDPQSEPSAQLLDGIRQHLEAIHRTLVFEKSSPWNVLATVAQCLAIGMLIVAALSWAYNPSQLLLVALIFQVMALTFYVRGK